MSNAVYACVCIVYRFTFNWKSNWPRGCLPVNRMQNQVTTVTKNHAIPSTIEMRIAGMAQINRRPAVSRLTGSA